KSPENRSTNTFDIPEGLVAKRKEELIAAKFPGYVAPSSEAIPVTNPIQNIKKESEARLNHLTKTRPNVSHRPPSRHPDKLKNSNSTVLVAIPEKKSELISAHSTQDLAALLKKAISNA